MGNLRLVAFDEYLIMLLCDMNMMYIFLKFRLLLHDARFDGFVTCRITQEQYK